MAVTKQHASNTQALILVFLRWLQASFPLGLPQVTPQTVAAFIPGLLARPRLGRSTTVEKYRTALSLLWPTACKARQVSDLMGGIFRCNPSRSPPQRGAAMAATAEVAAAATLPVIRGRLHSGSLADVRLWLAAEALDRGFRPIEASRLMEREGLATEVKWNRLEDGSWAANFFLAYTKGDRRGAAPTPPDRPLILSSAQRRSLLRALATPMTPSEASELDQQIKRIWREGGLANLYAMRHRAARLVTQNTEAPPGVMRTHVEAVLDHHPGLQVTGRYTALRRDAASAALAGRLARGRQNQLAF